MNDKPLASLSPTLLARKGGAKPAMRSQLHYPDSLARAVVEDDLGWNDMGQEQAQEPAPQPTSIAEPDPVAEPEPVAEAPEQRSGEVVPFAGTTLHQPEPQVPMVRRQQAAIAERVAPEPAAIAERVAPEPAASRTRRSALDDGRRAAFTLRVDADRHLKLRLACTIRNRSAQQLVTEALDRLIDELPDLATLAAQVAERR